MKKTYCTPIAVSMTASSTDLIRTSNPNASNEVGKDITLDWNEI